MRKRYCICCGKKFKTNDNHIKYCSVDCEKSVRQKHKSVKPKPTLSISEIVSIARAHDLSYGQVVVAGFIN